ncbi:hypothetical protein [Micrococcus sp. H39-S4]|uniref:hypothetical protein n=1 Tax=Micrococcus sp. H39-S4 TaxID=3004356 RepID=UPI0022AF92A9|nr:hypothetical protein [Micrococcus sp. H39-S4]MCZ4071322.1 hypothetical protein [Micrococcus sp. H39-S4]
MSNPGRRPPPAHDAAGNEQRGQTRWPSLGSPHGRQRVIPWPPMGSFSWPLTGVNGLPGTGKMTMLRDILASNVVERARRLSACENPLDAFTERTHEWTGEGRMRRRARELRPEVAGLEKVVASANNADEENLSEEIPHRSAIKDGRNVDADYFACLATAALGGSGGGRGRPG